MGMMVLTCFDVVGSFFGYPILGSEEVVGMMAFLLLAFALPYTEMEKGHVGVDLLHMRLSERVKRVNDSVVALLSVIFFCLVAWQCYLYASEMGRAGQVSPTLKFPTYYLIYGISLSCLALAFVIFVEFMAFFKKGDSNE